MKYKKKKQQSSPLLETQEYFDRSSGLLIRRFDEVERWKKKRLNHELANNDPLLPSHGRALELKAGYLDNCAATLANLPP